ncbi:MAG: Formate dehydrogenase beta subunit, partial [Actinomyces urogenitalis DORA_12]
LYGANPQDGVGGTGSVFLLMDEPEAYGLPPDPEVPTADLASMFNFAGVAGTAMIATALGMFIAHGRQK